MTISAARLFYGPGEHQFGDLRTPGGAGPHPVIISIHGGFWKAKYGLEYNEKLAVWFAAQGYATWNIEYRRVGHPGGGYPGTLQDVAAAADHLRTLAAAHQLDLGRVAAVGHSAGGHLALWLAAGQRLQAGQRWQAGRRLPLCGVLALAGVADLAAMHAIHAGRGLEPAECPVPGFLGAEPAAVPDRLAAACPARLAPLGVPTVLAHGADDEIVPLSVAESYARRAGPEAELLVLPGVDHFQVIDPESAAWGPIAAALVRLLGQP